MGGRRRPPGAEDQLAPRSGSGRRPIGAAGGRIKEAAPTQRAEGPLDSVTPPLRWNDPARSIRGNPEPLWWKAVPDSARRSSKKDQHFQWRFDGVSARINCFRHTLLSYALDCGTGIFNNFFNVLYLF